MTDIVADIVVTDKYMMFIHEQDPRGIFSITAHEAGLEKNSTDGQRKSFSGLRGGK